MQIGPRNPEHLTGSISDYVQEKYATKDQRDGKLADHYGYPVPHSETAKGKQRSKLHKTLREHWDGELPTVLDPTAGGGTIPMESLRYGLPTGSNELNPVAWIINKVVLNYAPKVGSLESPVRKWTNKIDDEASKRLKEYFPSAKEGQEPTYYFCAYSIECPSCGKRLPLSNRWWFYKKSASEGHAFKPIPNEDEVKFEHIRLPDDSEDDFDPSEGTISRGDATCPSCGVVTESEQVKERFVNSDFQFEICGVKYTGTTSKVSSGFRAPTKEDKEAFQKATERIEQDIDLATLLTTNIPEGNKTAEPRNWGITEWREVFNPRQLLAHATYQQVFEEYKGDIKEEYDSETSEAILVLLSLIATKTVNRNSRLEPIDIRPRGAGAPNSMLGTNNFAYQWQFGETNLCVGSYSYSDIADQILEKYEELVGYFDIDDVPEAEVTQGDASDLSQESGSVDAVVVDPPYGDNVMYAELSDVLYVWLREYLQNEMSEFSPAVTNKEEEAVENIARFTDDDVNQDTSVNSKSELANRYYEQKMADIFQETYRVLDTGGVLTVYFTEKEIDAWDSLTMSLIRSGFNITATHPITSEMPQRIGMMGSASADTTLLLTCRKPLDANSHSQRQRTLWSNIEEKTREVAANKANELLDSDLNLTKTDTIVSAFGPTLRVFTENFPVVDKHGDEIRPKEALQEARTAVIDVLVNRELEHTLDGVDDLTTWYILCWLVYEREKIPHDEARQLGIGVGVYIDEIKRDTKIWGKSGEDLILKDKSSRVQDFDKLKAGAKRRTRKFPVNPQDVNFEYDIDAVHAALNVLETEGGNTTWNWLKDRNLADDPVFKRTIKSLINVLPEDHKDRELLSDLIVGKTGELLDIDVDIVESNQDTESSTLTDYSQ
jgi:adenine-specific DNA methylase